MLWIELDVVKLKGGVSLLYFIKTCLVLGQ